MEYYAIFKEFVVKIKPKKFSLFGQSQMIYIILIKFTKIMKY